jgi:hypothetical protein
LIESRRAEPARDALRRFVAERTVRALAVVVLAPGLDDPRGLGERAEPVLVQALIPEPAMKLSTNAFWIGLPGWMKRSRTPVRTDRRTGRGR